MVHLFLKLLKIIIIPSCFLFVYFETEFFSLSLVEIKSVPNKNKLLLKNCDTLFVFNNKIESYSFTFENKKYKFHKNPITISSEIDNKLLFRSTIEPISGYLFKIKKRLFLKYKIYFTNKDGSYKLKKRLKEIYIFKPFPFLYLSLYFLLLLFIKFFNIYKTTIKDLKNKKNKLLIINLFFYISIIISDKNRIYFSKKKLNNYLRDNNFKLLSLNKSIFFSINTFQNETINYQSITQNLISDIHCNLLKINTKSSGINIDRAEDWLNSLFKLNSYNSLKIIKFDLIEFIDNYLKTTHSHNIDRIEFIYDLPSAFIKCDKNLLETILNNLILNALQEIERCDNSIHRITINITHKESLYLEISNLIFKEVDLKNIIKPGVSTKDYGSGIGLNVVKQLSYKLNIRFNVEIKNNHFIARLRFDL